MLALSPDAWAQGAPKTISPLRIEPDVNGVNLATGKIQQPVPTLSVPAAPRLTFDLVQNAAPYVTSVTAGDQQPFSNVAIHTGRDGSETFECVDYDCQSSGIGSGSTYRFKLRFFMQAGSGNLTKFNTKSYDTLIGTSFYALYYATTVTYPDGEVLSYSYDSATVPSDVRTYYRPNRITSSTGYYITISYVEPVFDPNSPDSVVTKRAALYGPGDPGNSLAELNYNGNVITDKAGRVFNCVCVNALDQQVERSSVSLTLPTESNTTLQATATAFPAASLAPLVTSVTRDGVAWTYFYLNPRYTTSCSGSPDVSGASFDRVTVTGPSNYNMAYDMNPGGCGGPASVAKATNALNQPTQYFYDSRLRPIRAISPELDEIVVEYDGFGNIIKKTSKAKPLSGLADIVERAFVDTQTCAAVLCYRPVWVRDGLDRQTDYVYNTKGQLTEQTDPADAMGVRRKTYVNYESGTLSRRSVVRICGTGAACGSNAEIRTEYTYWANTFLPSIERRIDAGRGLTAETAYTYDPAGRTLVVDGPLPGTGDAIYYRYDVLGRRTWEIGAAGANGKRVAKRITYRDADDKVTKTEIGNVPDPASPILTLYEQEDVVYDVRRYPVRIARSSGGTTYAVTDRSFLDRGLPECETVRMDPATFGSASPGACTPGAAGSFGPDRVSKRLYDSAGQMLTLQVALGTPDSADEQNYHYTPNGRRDRVTDGEGNRTTYEYDGFDRLVKTRFPSPTVPGTSSTTDYEGLGYDLAGNVVSRRLRDGQSIGYTFDNLNRVTVKDVPAGVSGEYDITTRYDVMSRPLDTTDAAGSLLRLSYDALGRTVSETGLGLTKTMDYDLAGRMTRLSWPAAAGATLSIDYDRLATGDVSKVRENAAASGGGVLATYGYDDLGRRTSLTRGNGVATGWGYDAIGRLQSLSHDAASSGNDVSWTFTYNPASQIATSERTNDFYAWTGHANRDLTETPNGLNQLVSQGSIALSYDGRGNTNAIGGTTYAYTSENRLTFAQPSGAGVTLRYDPGGRLYRLTLAADVTLFDYLGPRILSELNDAGVTLRRYVPGAGEDETLVWYEGSGLADRRWLLADPQGSTVGITDANGTVTSINSFDEYGVPAATNVGRFQYTGQAWLPELGLHYYKARMYNPATGRFMQTDPIGYDNGINWYAYVGNDPVNRKDPTGREGVGHNGGPPLDDPPPTIRIPWNPLSALIMLVTPSSAGPLPNPEAQARIDRIQGRIDNRSNVVNGRHIDAALREARGETVALRPDGKPFDHINELRETANGLRNDIRQLQAQYGRNLGEDQAMRLGRQISQASKMLDTVSRTLQKVERICAQTKTCP